MRIKPHHTKLTLLAAVVKDGDFYKLQITKLTQSVSMYGIPFPDQVFTLENVNPLAGVNGVTDFLEDIIEDHYQTEGASDNWHILTTNQSSTWILYQSLD